MLDWTFLITSTNDCLFEVLESAFVVVGVAKLLFDPDGEV